MKQRRRPVGSRGQLVLGLCFDLALRARDMTRSTCSNESMFSFSGMERYGQ